MHYERTLDDPVFAAIARHCEAERAWFAALRDSYEAADAALDCAHEALVEWLKTVPTTVEGVIATLEHASARDDSSEHTNLLEGAHYAGERLAASEQFPAMIADALRAIVDS
jgi:hypothetical protein